MDIDNGANKANKENKELLPLKKEVKLMAKAIQSTPVLRGRDLVDLVTDIKRPDTNKARRQKALSLMQKVSKAK